MNVKHPLMVKIDINNCNDIHEAYQKIKNLNLDAKIHGELIIVKYPKSMKYTDKDYILKSRGIIINFSTKAIINSSLEGCIDLDTFNCKVDDWDSVVVEECLDGTLINLYYNNKWMISTKFCINGEDSRFKNNKTFKELFDSVFPIDYSSLDKSYTYSFLLQHKESRIVSPILDNTIYHLESTNNITGEKVDINISDIKKPQLLKYKDIVNKLNVNNMEELINKVNNLPWCNPGYILYSIDRKYRTKIENPNYTKVLNMVKDQSNINYILLDCIFKKNTIEDLLCYYPEYTSATVKVNNDFNTYATNLFQFYTKCKINNEFVNLEKKYKKPLCDVHNLFKSKRKNGNYSFKITFNEVVDILKNYDTPYLYSIIY